MRALVLAIFLFLVSLALAPYASAIVILPAVILIPVAKIVAVIIGGMSIPAVGIATYWHKAFGSKLGKTLFVSLGVVVLLGVLVGLVLHFINVL